MVEQATENRCVGGSIPPGHHNYEKKILYLAIFIFVNSCKSSSNEYFPVNQGLKWTYSIKISSSYTGKDYLKNP